MHREWLSEIEARIANIRAERKGEGQTLTPQGARALAGEWYKWFALQMAANKWSGKALARLSGPCMGRTVRRDRSAWPVLR